MQQSARLSLCTGYAKQDLAPAPAHQHIPISRKVLSLVLRLDPKAMSMTATRSTGQVLMAG